MLRRDLGVALVVDDQPELRELLCDALAMEGFRPRPAADGQEAMERLRAESAELPALITLDLKMPRMSGWELLRALRADAALSRIPVIVVAGRTAEQAGISDSEVAGYFMKPLDLTEFLATVERAFAA